jgi:hypothetical protein
VLEVRTFGAFGNVEILTQRERAAELAEDDAEDRRELRGERLEDAEDED